jgi:hypothetical protein
MKMTRRNFIRTGAGATATATLASSVIAMGKREAKTDYGPMNKWPGRVVVQYNSNASTGMEANEEVVKAMVDSSIKELAGKSEVGEAWKTVFPSLSQKTKIAIKINILNPVVPPHPFAVMAITEGLQKMNVEGNAFPASSIFIYDGFNGRSFDDAGYTVERFPGISMTHHRKDIKDFGDGAHNNEPYAQTLHDCDYLINVPGIRGHADYAGHVTLGFKSHYGTYRPKYHDMENTPGFLRDINCTGPVHKKTVITVFGGIFGKKEGDGPRGDADSYLTYSKKMDPNTDNPAMNTVILSTDPITAEYQAIKIMRMRDDKPFTVDSMPSYLKASAGKEGVLDKTYNIGVIDPANMDVRSFINDKKV